jgi:CheY-like chemotaxis protein
MQVLLLDGNRIERELISEILTILDCEVTAVASKHKFINLVKKKRFDLIIVDQSIQKVDVDDFVIELSEMLPLTPVAMMVTADSESLAAEYGKFNVDLLISRPFGYRELKSLVKEATLLSKKLTNRKLDT